MSFSDRFSSSLVVAPLAVAVPAAPPNRLKGLAVSAAMNVAPSGLRRWFAPLRGSAWREVVHPKEHGSWSLAFEPIAFGLLAAPSLGGAWLGVAAAAAFFSRRPLKIAWNDPEPARRAVARSAVAVCVGVAATAAAFAVGTAGMAWLPWTLPTLLAGAAFVSFDLRNSARTGLAEVLGVMAFGHWPAVLAMAAGAPPARALALAVLMLGRSVPTVLCVRSCLRAAKTGVRASGPALVAAALALAAAGALWRAELIPGTAVLMPAVLAGRSVLLLVFPRPTLPARTLGMIEGGLGLLFVMLASGAIP